MGDDPLLTDPENGDFRPLPGSPAEAYGCQTFPGTLRRALAQTGGPLRSSPPPLLAGDMPARFHQPLRTSAVTAGADESEEADDSEEAAISAASCARASGRLDGRTVWDADTVHVTGDILVPAGAELEILPAVQVLFDGPYALSVQGTLTAVGMPLEPIRFTSRAPELFAVDSTMAGSWRGIRFEQTPATGDSSRLSYCVVEYCKAAGDGSRGAALHLTGFSKLRADNCIFRHNVADYGAVAYCANFAAPTFAGCLMHDNHAFVSGSAVYCVDAYPLIAACTIVDNHVLNPDIFDEAGTIHNHISKSKPVGCILRANSSNYFLDGQILEPKLYYVIHNNIEGGYAGEGNFDLDPIFADNGPHPFALLEGSPCINAGPPDAAPWRLPPLDLAGETRLREGRVDVGAYEWQPVSTVPGAGEEGGGGLAGHGPVILQLAAHPNPSRSRTTLCLVLASTERVDLSIHDANGRRLSTLWRGDLAPGTHHFDWNGTDARGRPLPAGIYWGVADRRTGGSPTAAAGTVDLVAGACGDTPAAIRILRLP